uniref:Uncharacterized protein n=1 Tax=Oryza nivara TaxID=4536 RepID=A0A0E0G4C5_ORYNI
MGRSPSSPKAVAKNVSKLSLASCAAGTQCNPVDSKMMKCIMR